MVGPLLDENPYIAHENVWNAWIDPDRFVVYVHATHAEPRIHFNDTIQVDFIPTRPTQWGHISLVHVALDLMERAFQNPSVVKCVFLSGACLPVKSSQVVYDILTADNASFICMCPRAQVEKRFKDGCSLLNHYQLKQIHKHSQWSIINQEHGRYLIGQRELIQQQFGAIDVKVPDECVFATLLLARQFPDIYKNRATTWVDWSNDDSNSPTCYYDISIAEFTKVLDNPEHLFARKFATDCVVGGVEPAYLFLKHKLGWRELAPHGH